ncbi:DUF2530 domain-containing protein [Sphaerisporangium sp. B11E5]|uniref:DUF2530 domain-containing protein n=1 Tax=Sphaerisporangium sp. B11E5 TaxID=3153563 RepID=UPI00325F180B
MNEPRPPDLAPLRTNDAATILAGTGLWAVALVVLLIVQPGPDRLWWIWTCVAGVGLGLFGCWYVWRRDRHGESGIDPEEGDPVVPGTAAISETQARPGDSGDPAGLTIRRDQP